MQRRDFLQASMVLAALGLPMTGRAQGLRRPLRPPPVPDPGPGGLVIEKLELAWLHDGTRMGAAFPRLFVRVYTRAGVVGEAYTFFWHSFDQVPGLIRDGLAPLLIGMDAMQVERCWQRCWLLLDEVSAGGVGHSLMPQFTRALAAVDAAIWDAVGKALEAPLYKLWGAYSNRLPVVTFDQRYRHPGPRFDAARFAARMAKLRDMGFAGVKLKPGRPPYTPAEDAVWVRVAREALGPDFILQADANTRWTVAEAIEFGRGVQDVNLRWLEEPCRTRRDMAAVRAATGLPICAGQSELEPQAARYLMTENAIDVCNYDPGYAGGPTAWRKVYGLAASFGVEMAVHQQPQLAGQLMAATPWAEKTGIEVYMRDMDPFFYELIENQGPIENGWYTLPEGPGFGFVYDRKLLARYSHPV